MSELTKLLIYGGVGILLYKLWKGKAIKIKVEPPGVPKSTPPSVDKKQMIQVFQPYPQKLTNAEWVQYANSLNIRMRADAGITAGSPQVQIKPKPRALPNVVNPPVPPLGLQPIQPVVRPAIIGQPAPAGVMVPVASKEPSEMDIIAADLYSETTPTHPVQYEEDIDTLKIQAQK